ncbi:hypothetical protein HDU93_006109, partial [Gonapodya sp. JEL0774]
LIRMVNVRFTDPKGGLLGMASVSLKVDAVLNVFGTSKKSESTTFSLGKGILHDVSFDFGGNDWNPVGEILASHKTSLVSALAAVIL